MSRSFFDLGVSSLLPLFLLVRSLTACQGAPSDRIEAPLEVGYVAFVQLDAERKPAQISALVEWAPGGPLPIFFGEDQPVWVLGYDRMAIDTLRIRADGSRAPISETLEVAKGCTPALPDAIFSRALGPAPELTLPGPGLTASWIDRACPRSSAQRISIEISCLQVSCLSQIEWKSEEGCGFDWLSVDCQPAVEPALGALRYDGSLCLERPSGGLCICSQADCSAECQQAPCPIQLHQGPSSPDPPFSVDRIAVLGSAKDWVPAEFFASISVFPEKISIGYVMAAIPVGDRLVASYLSEPSRVCEGHQPRMAGSLLAFYDAESLALIESSTAPPCLDRLVPHPDQQAVLGLYTTPAGDNHLARFDFSGRLVMDQDLGPSPYGPHTDYFAAALEPIPQSRRVLATFSTYETEGNGWAVIFDADTLLEVSRHEFPPRHRPTSVAVQDSTTALIGMGRLTVVQHFDLSRGEVLDETELELPIAFDLLGISAVPSSTRFAVATKDNLRLVNSQSGRELARMASWWSPMDILTAAPWPLDENLLLLAGMTPAFVTEREALVAFVDLRQNRLLPGTFAVGHGLVNQIERDTQGRLWLTLPWSGEVLRLTPH